MLVPLIVAVRNPTDSYICIAYSSEMPMYCLFIDIPRVIEMGFLLLANISASSEVGYMQQTTYCDVNGHCRKKVRELNVELGC